MSALCPWCSTPEAEHSEGRLAAGEHFVRTLGPTEAYDEGYARRWLREHPPITPMPHMSSEER